METQVRIVTVLAKALTAFAVLVPLSLAGPSPAMAQAEKGPQVINPVEDFNRTLGEVRDNLGALSGKIDQATKDIEKVTAPEAARRELGELQALIADALGAVSDNGPVAVLGQKVIDFARTKQRQVESEGKYTPEERQFLQKEWSRISSDAQRATEDLTAARQEFAKLLRTVQTRSDYIEELQALNNAEQMLQVVRRLADDIRNASTALKSFIKAVTPPEPGT
jgi:chromosome segregation ATPase